MIVGLSVRGPIPVSEPDASQTIGSRFNGVVHVMTLERIKLRVGKVVILEAPVARGRGGALAGVWAAAIVADLRRQDR